MTFQREAIGTQGIVSRYAPIRQKFAKFFITNRTFDVVSSVEDGHDPEYNMAKALQILPGDLAKGNADEGFASCESIKVSDLSGAKVI